MCFYNSNSKRAIALAKRYGRKTDIIEIIKEIQEEQYKINAFTHPDCPIVTTNESIEVAKWGLIPQWTKSIEEADKIRNFCLNTRSETVFSKPACKSPVFSKRCLIPSTGYFEFHHKTDKSVVPYFIFLPNEEIFSMGGLYEKWQNPTTSETVQTFTLLTVPANKLCREVHNGGKNPYRMPLIINKESENFWLDSSLKINDIQSFFQPFNTNLMDAYPISKDFLKKKPNDFSIIERINMNLFQPA